MSNEKALSEHDFAALMRPFVLEDGPLAIAVSGGPDSMALTFCLKRMFGSRPLVALIVEHGLREESVCEAQLVAGRLRTMGVEAEILPWVHEKVRSRIHVRARDARYNLLRQTCEKRGIKTLFVAHHADDQAETILMRFAKGSGIDGLAGIDVETTQRGLRILRPFMTVRKETLIATCKANNIPYVIDPSNETDKYARGRLRRVMPLLEKEGLTHDRLIDLGCRAREAKDALDHYVYAFLKKSAEVIAGGAVRVDLAALRGLPYAVAQRTVSLILTELNKGAYPPERKLLLPFMDWLCDQDAYDARTLHCCLAQKGEVCDKATFMRELACVTSVVPITAGQKVEWDGRWLLTYNGQETGLEVRALGIQPHDLIDALAPQLRARIPQGRVRSTLPSLWQGVKLVAIPAFHKEDQGVVCASPIAFCWE